MPLQPWAAYWATPGCGFLDPVYEAREGTLHPGVDLNIRTGGDTDLGKPIYNVTDGVVVAARWYSVWGNIIEVYHPGPDLYTLHAHCQRLLVRKGRKVSAGQQIATVGKGAPDKNHPNGRYWAHDHFEVRLFGPDVLAPNDWPSARLSRRDALEEINATRVDPMPWLKKVGALFVLPDAA